VNDSLGLLKNGSIKNVFIFGEDPVGCAVEKDYIKKLISKSDFKVVQDYFITETAETADLILPASYPFENGGSYSNTQKYLVNFDAVMDSKVEKKNYEQLIDMMGKLGVKSRVDLTHNITLEIASLLGNSKSKDKEYCLTHTSEDDSNRMFNYGCDYLVKRFEEKFKQSFEK
jgi:formate dehydrogenase major subunit